MILSTLLHLYFFAEFKITLGVDSLEKQSFEDSAKLAIEAITNIRTVAGRARKTSLSLMPSPTQKRLQLRLGR